MKRALDLLLSIAVLSLFGSLFLLVALAVWLSSPGPVIYWSNRVGKGNTIFKMPKFRSMLVNTPTVATHLLVDPDQWLTPIGSFLRKTSLDELPQIWSIIKGEMSFVGPRPALFNQMDLIKLRTDLGLEILTPGLTGWAQVNGRDNLTIYQKVKLDEEYAQQISILFDLKIIILTARKILKNDSVSH